MDQYPYPYQTKDTYTILHAAVRTLHRGLSLSQFLYGLTCRSFAKVCPIAVVPTIRQGLSTRSFTLLYARSGPPLLYITIAQCGTPSAVSWDSCSTDGLRTVAN